MLALLCPLLFAAQPAERPSAIDLDTLTLADMRQFDGKPVVAYFTAAAPLYT